MRIIRHLGLVDGDAVHALRPAYRGTPGGRKRGGDHDALTTRSAQGRGEFCGDVSPQGGIQLLVDDARFSRRARRFEDTLRGEARWHGAGVGIERHSVEIICEFPGFTKEHGRPVASVDELDAGIRRAGQIVRDNSYQQVGQTRAS
jgi:hypothetical protein